MSTGVGQSPTGALTGSSIGLAKVITLHNPMSNSRRFLERKVLPATQIGFFMPGESERDLIRQDSARIALGGARQSSRPMAGIRGSRATVARAGGRGR